MEILGFITAIGLAVGAITIRSAKSKNLVLTAVIGKLFVAMFALFLLKVLLFRKTWYSTFIILCVAIPFVLVTIAQDLQLLKLIFSSLEQLLVQWVWFISIETLYGGAIILATIAIHSFLKLKILISVQLSLDLLIDGG